MDSAPQNVGGPASFPGKDQEDPFPRTPSHIFIPRKVSGEGSGRSLPQNSLAHLHTQKGFRGRIRKIPSPKFPLKSSNRGGPSQLPREGSGRSLPQNSLPSLTLPCRRFGVACRTVRVTHVGFFWGARALQTELLVL